ncbi:hypothetical protein ACFW1A_40180 [Kitasatospora sp. NPDC058965]|uniref:hypothetical protein n=1 Tax=Kitasatospora sp. NPDC058965 TaxID=3346682 RepID=UPI00367895CF
MGAGLGTARTAGTWVLASAVVLGGAALAWGEPVGASPAAQASGPATAPDSPPPAGSGASAPATPGGSPSPSATPDCPPAPIATATASPTPTAPPPASPSSTHGACPTPSPSPTPTGSRTVALAGGARTGGRAHQALPGGAPSAVAVQLVDAPSASADPSSTPAPVAGEFSGTIVTTFGGDAGLTAVGGGLFLAAGGGAMWLKRRHAAKKA